MNNSTTVSERLKVDYKYRKLNVMFKFISAVVLILLTIALVVFVQTPLFAKAKSSFLPQNISLVRFNETFLRKCRAVAPFSNEKQRNSYISKLFQSIDTGTYFDREINRSESPISDFSVTPQDISSKQDVSQPDKICWKLEFFDELKNNKQIVFLNKYGIYEVFIIK
jgi:hypothetical protein